MYGSKKKVYKFGSKKSVYKIGEIGLEIWKQKISQEIWNQEKQYRNLAPKIKSRSNMEARKKSIHFAAQTQSRYLAARKISLEIL